MSSSSNSISHLTNKWERKLGIHTTGDKESLADKFHSPYQPTPYCILELILGLGLIKKDNTLIDYGCGKGRVVIFFSRQTKCNSIGIDYDAQLISCARANANSDPLVRFYQENAESFPIPEKADVFFFFNPFGRDLLIRVINKISASFAANPRRIILLFYYAVYDLEFLSDYGFNLIEMLDTNYLFNTKSSQERILVYDLKP